MCYTLCRYTADQCEELLKDEAAFKALLQEAIKGSPVRESTSPALPSMLVVIVCLTARTQHCTCTSFSLQPRQCAALPLRSAACQHDTNEGKWSRASSCVLLFLCRWQQHWKRSVSRTGSWQSQTSTSRQLSMRWAASAPDLVWVPKHLFCNQLCLVVPVVLCCRPAADTPSHTCWWRLLCGCRFVTSWQSCAAVSTHSSSHALMSCCQDSRR